MKCANALWIATLTLALPAMAMAGPAVHEAAAEEANVVHQLTPAWPAALFNLLMFLALFFVLAKFVWPKILEGLQAREQKIGDDLRSAEQAHAEASALKKDFEQKIAEAHAESRKLLDEARADAETLRVKLKADTEAEMTSLRQRASEDIDQARKQALTDLHGHAVELATLVAGKVIGRQIQDVDTQRLVDESLEQLNRMN